MGLTDKLLSADTRDILSLMVGAILSYGVVTGYVSADDFVKITLIVIGFWFGAKSNGER